MIFNHLIQPPGDFRSNSQTAIKNLKSDPQTTGQAGLQVFRVRQESVIRDGIQPEKAFINQFWTLMVQPMALVY